MKRLLLLCFFAALADVGARAGPTEDAIVAMMRLSEQPNYSWVATISDDARTYDIRGQTVRGGYTRVTMPIVNSVRRQIGRSVTDPQVDLVFRGNVDCVIETEDGWRKPSELSGMNDGSSRNGGARSYPGTGAPGRRLRGGSVIRSPNGPPEARRSSYSNLQLGISHPHEDLGVMVGSNCGLRVEGDTITGELTDLGAQLLLVRDGQETIEPLRAAGTFKIWLRDGMVVRYQVKLQGTLAVRSPGGSRREINVSQVTETTLNEVGATTFEVPEQAREKLGG